MKSIIVPAFGVHGIIPASYNGNYPGKSANGTFEEIGDTYDGNVVIRSGLQSNDGRVDELAEAGIFTPEADRGRQRFYIILPKIDAKEDQPAENPVVKHIFDGEKTSKRYLITRVSGWGFVVPHLTDLLDMSMNEVGNDLRVKAEVRPDGRYKGSPVRIGKIS